MAAAVALLTSPAVRAVPTYLTDLFTRYPAAAASLPGCLSCHEDPANGSLNPFGLAFLDNGYVLDEVLEALDSDGDGYTNGVELAATPATAPGDPNSKPGSSTVPAPPVMDGPALYAKHCASCHGPLAASAKTGATLARTQSAIAGNAGGMGYLSSLTAAQLEAIVSALAPSSLSSSNYTGLWWTPSEAGWGISVNHQGDTVFAIVYSYDAAGSPMWLVMSSGRLQPDGRTFSGDLHRAKGPAFDAVPFAPFTPANLVRVGTLSLTFAGVNSASLTYSVGGVTVNKSIVPQVYGTSAASCTTTTASRAGLANYQDLWWNPAESGWGVNIAHQNDTLFATLFTYDSSGKDLWLVMSAGVRQPDGSFAGALYSARGPAFDAQPFTRLSASDLSAVGEMRFAFADGNAGTLTYSVNGVAVSKSITRQAFSSPLPACSMPSSTVPVSVDGPALYASQCASCHQPLAASTKGGATLARIQGAISGNAGGMGYLSILSTAQLEAIAGALASLAPTSAACGSCHGIPPGSGDHARHDSRIPCATCHGGGYSSSTTDPATHRNGIKEILASIGWSGSTQSCANSCHGTAPWSATATLSCTSCHGTPPATGVHAKHNASYSCDACHGAGYGATRVNAATHRNGIRELLASIGWNATNRTCANSCHGTGTWAPTATLSCTSCHGTPPSTGHHSKHRSRSCDTCHGAGYTSTTVNAATHRDGLRNVVASTGWNATTRTCANSCHGRETW